MRAAGAGAAVVYHRAYDLPGAPGRPGIAEIPQAEAWRDYIEQIPLRERHLHTHQGHLTFPNDIDRKVLTGDVIQRYTLTGTPEEIRARIADLAARGATEIVYQPAGPDIPRELEMFARTAGLPS